MNENDTTETLPSAATAEVTAVAVEPAAPDGSTGARKANRFYDRIRRSITGYVAKRGKALGKSAELLLFVPDIFILMWRLTNDSRVSGKNKVLLGSGIAYYIFPLDIVPEVLLGPIGFMDDLVFGVYILNRILSETDEAAIHEHWSGSENVLSVIQRVVSSADQLVGKDFLAQIKKFVR